MSENLDRRERDFSRFDSMTTEQLQQILRLDATKPQGEESDTEELFYIMEVLADRRRNDSNFTGKTAQEAFKDFQKYYMPVDDNNEKSTDMAPVKEKKSPIRWLRRATAVAAVLAVVFFTTLTVDAFGFDLFGKVAKWSKEFFHFEDVTQETTTPDPVLHEPVEYESLQEALDSFGIEQKLAPNWLPDGCELYEVKVKDSPHEISISAYYQNGEEELVISIRQLLTSMPEQVEKTDDLIGVHVSNGIAYYLFNNYDTIRANWVVGEYECYIIGAISVEEMKEIIDSI